MEIDNDIDEGGFTLCSPKYADCRRSLTCERVHFKGSRDGLHVLDLSCNLTPQGDCPYYVPRPIIADHKYLFGSGKKRHNAHAPRTGSKRPDLMVKRHIRNGKDINSNGDDN